MLFFLEREVPAFLRLLMFPKSEFLATVTALFRNISECEDFTVVLAAFKDSNIFGLRYSALTFGGNRMRVLLAIVATLFFASGLTAVSYTHLTLPTKRIV